MIWANKHNKSITEPRHDKTNKMSMRPVKTHISLGIHPVWSVFAVCMKNPCVLSYPLSAQRRLWSDWEDAQADLSTMGAHLFCWFCHVAAQLAVRYKNEFQENIMNYLTIGFFWICYRTKTHMHSETDRQREREYILVMHWSKYH